MRSSAAVSLPRVPVARLRSRPDIRPGDTYVIFGATHCDLQASMTHHDHEFAALRATIRERGTARMILLPLTFAIWGGVAVATTAAIQLPIAALLPLLVLAAGFE